MFKLAAKPKPVTAFSGRLVHSKSGWVLLEVPNAFVRGAFAMLSVPGAELPPSGPNGRLNAHISVMRPEEVESIGDADKINELGKTFSFQVGNLKEVNPSGWAEMDKVWLLNVVSPELQNLRKSYGLPGKPHRKGVELNFHITVGVRRRGVFRDGRINKAARFLRNFSTQNKFRNLF